MVHSTNNAVALVIRGVDVDRTRRGWKALPILQNSVDEYLSKVYRSCSAELDLDYTRTEADQYTGTDDATGTDQYTGIEETGDFYDEGTGSDYSPRVASRIRAHTVCVSHRASSISHCNQVV
jgi:hypothetical protein